MSNTYITLLQKDLKFGENQEDLTKENLEKYIGSPLVKQPNNSIFDYFSEEDKIYIELKTRRNTKNKYPTTMVGYNKIVEANKLIKEGYKIYFAFKYTDNLCFYKYTDENTDWIQKGGRFDRGRAEIKQYYFIPTSSLSDFSSS